LVSIEPFVAWTRRPSYERFRGLFSVSLKLSFLRLVFQEKNGLGILNS
jgi:hypothetical protein